MIREKTAAVCASRNDMGCYVRSVGMRHAFAIEMALGTHLAKWEMVKPAGGNFTKHPLHAQRLNKKISKCTAKLNSKVDRGVLKKRKFTFFNVLDLFRFSFTKHHGHGDNGLSAIWLDKSFAWHRTSGSGFTSD